MVSEDPHAQEILKMPSRSPPSSCRIGSYPSLVLLAWLAAVLPWSLGCGSAGKSGSGQPPRDPAQELETAVKARDWNRALEVSGQAMIANPDDPSVITNAAIAAANVGRRMEAALMLVDAARATGFAPGVRIDNAYRGLLDVGQLHEAIDLLENVVERYPQASEYRRRLVGFLGEAQRNEDANPHISRLIRDRQFDLPLLLATTELSSRRFSPKTIETLAAKNPDDLRPRLGQAKALLGSRNAEGARQVLRKVVDRHPDFAPGHAMLGAVLVGTGRHDELPDWFSRLAPDTPKYAGYWVAVGEWAMETGQTSGAVRAFAEATRRSRNDSGTWSRLAKAIRKLSAERAASSEKYEDEASAIDLDAIAASIDRRRHDLLELRERFAKFRTGDFRSQKVAAEIAGELLELGRVWEAEAWLAIATQLPDEQSDELTDLRNEAIRRLSKDRDWQSRSGHLELSFDLSRFPLPSGLDRSENPAAELTSSVTRQATRPDTSGALSIRLAEESRQRRLRFYGRVGSGVKGPRVPIHQTLGCGGGVIDFDNDGRHDLVFAAAGGSIRGSDSDPGALFRNLGSSFVEVSSDSSFADRRFGYGIVVGDYNDDGFQDIAVMNLGRNGLFRNNGDGTFSDASDQLAEIDEGDWSTSGAIADVDGDGLNDLVVINYCDADQPFDQPCFDSEGREVNCYPLRYRAGRDRFLRGQPDGRFRDVTERWAPQPAAGRGLGIVVGRLDGQSQCAYVVNDASINHFYRWYASSQADGGASGELIDAGIASGLAVDAQSLDQGSMGIASGDWDHDGDLDLYVTGFNQEYNIYYEQSSPGFWSDRTASLGMVPDTLNLVGFGTEAIDFDNDGLDELLVSNGHIGDFGSGSSPYAQPLQLFRVAADGKYRLTDIDAWGEYFSSPHVGRALFSCDVNRDGRSDVVVTHATEPAALLVNHSDRKHHRIAFRLVGTQQTRDAIGAVLQFSLKPAGERMRRRSLYRLSGDGYLCSNQPELRAGTGAETVVYDVLVSWPDGEQQELGDLQADAEYLIVQGEPPFQLQTYGGN